KADELVSAKARDDATVAHRMAQLLRDLADEPVAGRVSAGIVHVLELVEVDEQQRAGRAGGRSPDLLELFDEPPAVEKTRERVVIREPRQPLVALAEGGRRGLQRFHDLGDL